MARADFNPGADTGDTVPGYFFTGPLGWCPDDAMTYDKVEHKANATLEGCPVPVIEVDILMAYINPKDKLHFTAVEIFKRAALDGLRILVPSSAFLSLSSI